MIWAAKSGNVEALAALITFDPAGRAKALELFQGLPAAVQADYGSPEKVYATLIAANVPLGLTQSLVVREEASGGERVTLVIQVQRHNASHNAQFSFQRSGTAWQLVVPEHIVENFGAMISGKTDPRKS